MTSTLGQIPDVLLPDRSANVTGMGTWAAGPFDNDTAADWSGDLDEAPAEERAQLVQDTLFAVTEAGGLLDADLACEAIAAAAVVASQRAGGAHLVATPYAPDLLAAGGSLELPDLAELSRRALDRVTGPGSQWLELWSEGGAESAAAALEEVAKVRALLS
jgi:hypothetical protein